MSESQRIVLTHALEVAVGLRNEDLRLLFTDDVRAWSPNLSAASVLELEEAFSDRSEALSNVTLDITSVDTVDSKTFAEWVFEADHTAPLVIGDVEVEATGRRLRLGGITVAQFSGNKIRSFRSYFDAVAPVEQLVASR